MSKYTVYHIDLSCDGDTTISYNNSVGKETFIAKMTGMNWSNNEITLELNDPASVSRDIMSRLLKRIGKFEDIDFRVTLDYIKD